MGTWEGRWEEDEGDPSPPQIIYLDPIMEQEQCKENDDMHLDEAGTESILIPWCCVTPEGWQSLIWIAKPTSTLSGLDEVVQFSSLMLALISSACQLMISNLESAWQCPKE